MDLLRPSFTDACGENDAARMLTELATASASVSSPLPTQLNIPTTAGVALTAMKAQKDHPPLDSEAVERIFSPRKQAVPLTVVATPTMGVTTELEFDTALDLINIVHKQQRPLNKSTSPSLVSPIYSEEDAAYLVPFSARRLATSFI